MFVSNHTHDKLGRYGSYITSTLIMKPIIGPPLHHPD